LCTTCTGEGCARRVTDKDKSSPRSLSAEEAVDARVVAKGGAIQTVGQIANRGLTLLFVAVAVRVLKADGYGLYRQVFQVLTIGTIIASGGFPHAALRFIARARALHDHSGSRGAARVTIVGTGTVSLVICAVVVFAPDRIASAFADSQGGENDFANLLVVGAAYIPLYSLMQTLRACTQAYKTMVPAVMVGNIIQPISRLVLGIGALVAGLALVGAVATLVISAGFGAIAGVWYYRRILSSEERKAKPFAKAGPIIRFTVPQTGNAFFSTGSLGLGVLILGLLSSDEAVGLFSLATSLQTAGNVFSNSIVAIWAPMVVDLYETGEIARLQLLYQATCRWLATFSFPVFGALLLEPDLFGRILGGDQSEGAVVLIPILAIGNMVRVGTGSSSQLLSMSGHPVVNLINSLVGVALYIGLGIWLVPIHGIIGMAVVDALVTILVNIARVVQAKVMIGIQPFGRSYIKPMAAMGGALAVNLIFQAILPETTFLEVAGLTLFGVVYMGVLKVLGIESEERHIVDVLSARVLKRSSRR
jgi:O-antigen/teichoic acid export membrane protein